MILNASVFRLYDRGHHSVASLITVNEQLQYNQGCFFPMLAMLPEDFPSLLHKVLKQQQQKRL